MINLEDSRNRRLALRVIEWVEQNIGAEDQRIHSKKLSDPQAFGSSPSGRWLQKYLLVQINDRFQPGEFSKQYRVNEQHLNYLRSLLGLPPTQLRFLRIEARFDQCEDQIASGDFEMNQAEWRSFHTLQYIARRHKADQWSQRGYPYDYDIECCAPTLLYQQAQRIHLTPLHLEAIEAYIEFKKEIRTELSIKLNIGEAVIKQILNGLFQGARMNPYYEHNRILAILGGNTYKMNQIRRNPYIQELQRDIRVMWSILRVKIDTGTEIIDGKEKSRRIRGVDKTNYYQMLESLVMKSVIGHLKKKKIKYFHEHDGFRSTRFIDPNELSDIVFGKTGFRIKFDWSVYDQE